MRAFLISMLLLVLGVVHPADANVVDSKFSITREALSFSPFTGEIKGNRVRMRLAPQTDSTIIKEFSKGELVAVIGESKDYYIVSAPHDLKGYVFRTFVLDNKIEGEQVNVRLEPTTSSPVLVRLSRGTSVFITSEQPHGKWLEISLPDQCAFYVAKNFVSHKGSIDLYQKLECQKKIALDILDSAVKFANIELEKDLKDIDLEAIYKKINQLQSDEFSDISGLQAIIQSALEKIQDAYLAKSLTKQESFSENQSNIKDSETSSSSLSSLENAPKTSLLSQHIRKQTLLSSQPLSKGRESLEHALFKIWASMQNSPKELTQEDFYREEYKHHKQVFTGVLETYSHVVKNNPGDYILRDNEQVLTFLYATKINLKDWIGKRVTVEAVSRPNNHFAFPAHYVLHIQEALN
ncbi:SH3 domain-containing protein [Chlamydia sp. 17-3921]|uniref:SH3 domain-containing protein n=1 Tax=Chlamydia sp. 17-3921 TaxID=2675798 RepID=UPI001F393665|nr:SH3 domain-containing protein [Chlamydia sp. 17-3921]